MVWNLSDGEADAAFDFSESARARSVTCGGESISAPCRRKGSTRRGALRRGGGAENFFADRLGNCRARGSTQKTEPIQERSGKSEALMGAEKGLRKVAHFGALLKFFLS